MDTKATSLEPLLRASNVRKTFLDSGQAAMLVLDATTLEAADGEFLAIVGPSGCGKSTLLRLLSGLEMPLSGEVRFRGELVTEPRREIGLMFQKPNLMPWLTVINNIALPLEIQGVRAEEARASAASLIALIGLEGFANSYPAQLSGGMQQRVSLARALIQDPQLLLLDEPFGALDALTRDRMNAELLRVWSLQRPTVVMVTHSIPEALFLADRVLVMSPRPGRVRAEFEVPLARPRQPSITSDPEFVQMVRRVREQIVD